LIGIVDGAAVTGGAEGVGRVTTNSVVHGITAIVLLDMLFVFATTR
jgi:phospholipid/cholesterol/gamma-HCH transport system permease protein